MKRSWGEKPTQGGSEQKRRELCGRREGSQRPFFGTGGTPVLGSRVLWCSCQGRAVDVSRQYSPKGACGKGAEALGIAPWVGSRRYVLQVCLVDHPPVAA